MILLQISKTMGIGAGALITQSGMAIFGASALLDYMGVSDPYTSNVIKSIAAATTATMISFTSINGLWKYFGPKKSDDLSTDHEDQSATGNYERAIKGVIIANIVPITLFSAYLSSDALLTLIKLNKIGMLITLAIYTTGSDFAAFFAFSFKIAAINTRKAFELYASCIRNDGEFNRRSAIKTLMLCIINTTAQVIFVNFSVKHSVMVFPGLNRIDNKSFRELVAGIISLSYIPLSLMKYGIQAYRYFESQDRQTTIPPRQSIIRHFGFNLFRLFGALYLLLDGATSYIASVDLFKQFGANPKSIPVQILAVLPGFCMAFSDYVFTYRNAELSAIEGIYNHTPEDQSIMEERPLINEASRENENKMSSCFSFFYKKKREPLNAPLAITTYQTGLFK